MMVPGVHRETIVGRRKELKILEHAVSNAMDGRGSTILVSGEAGIGKSRLVEEFRGLAAQLLELARDVLTNSDDPIDRARFHYEYGLLLRVQGHESEARQFFEKALELYEIAGNQLMCQRVQDSLEP